MSTSNVPALSITASGVSVPATQDILNGVLADYNSAFGGNLNIANVATPQGALASDTTTYIQNANAAMAFLVGQVDPSTSQGRFQDGIGRIYYIARNPATATVVNGQVTGQLGVQLPAGSLATDGTYTYATLNPVTFGAGPVSVQFACTTLGPISVGANQMNRIATQVPGWDSVTNPTAGVTGTAVESQAAFEQRRSASTAANAQGTPAAVLGAVLSVSGVIDAYVLDNPLGTPVTVGATNYSMLQNSLLVSVVGGSSSAVANAIWTKKGPGCNMNGNTTVTVTDTSSLANPQPTYPITYLVPTSTPIYFVVNIANSSTLPATIISQTQAAIVAAFTGTDGSSRERIAGTIYASKYYAGISAIGNVSVLSIYVGQSASPTATSTAMGADQVPTIQSSNIAVNII